MGVVRRVLISATLAGLASIVGCGGGSDFYGAGSLFRFFANPALNPPAGPSSSGTSSGGQFGGSDRSSSDPCTEPQSRKFLRISMRNLAPDNIHYFLALIAHVNGARYPAGAVCPDDIALYTQFGYEEISEGDTRSFGNICIEGPALLYFHEEGEFRSASGDLAAGIEPSRGTGATFDRFFTSAGALVPVPNLILFHNPGTGPGFELKVAPTPGDPCNDSVSFPDCLQDAFYYVGDFDLQIGTTALGVGSARRVPGEIQGTGCDCNSTGDPWQELAPSNATAASANCNEFLRGGTINYAFVRDDDTPPFPQLVWQVLDDGSSLVHDFDPRANVAP